MLFLAHLLGASVVGKQGEPVGTLHDLVLRIDQSLYPPISGLVVSDRGRSFYVPATHLDQLNGKVQLNSTTIDLKAFRRRDGEVLLGRDVLDHQIIDITGRRLVRVNDVQLAPVEGIIRVVGVDISPQALMRRLAPRILAEKIIGRQIINWADAQYLASAAPVQLKVSYDRLAEMNPVDLARIVDALSFRESAELVAGLDDETAAETLEEVSDERLADLLEEMDQERAADLLEEMTPSAAADILEDLDENVAEGLLARMEPEEAADVQSLLAYDEDSVGRILTTDYVTIAYGATVADALDRLRSLDEPPDPLLAIYLTEPLARDTERLLGVVRLRQLLISDPRTPLAEIVEDDVPSVHPDDRAEEAARLLAEYNLLAVPVIADDRFIGIVTVDDALAVLLPEIWQRRGARVFG